MSSWSGHPLDAEVYWDPCPVVPVRGLQGVPLGFWAALEAEELEGPAEKGLDKRAPGA